MTPKAVILDVYGTLLEIGPPSGDLETLWRRLFEGRLPAIPGLRPAAFYAAADEHIAQRHNQARARGIRWPEVQWQSIAMELLPELAGASGEVRDDLIAGLVQIRRTTGLKAEAADALRRFRDDGRLLGLASNAQPYTLRELAFALLQRGLDLDLFERDLRFWSFEHGFSKPDPHVFQCLGARLEARGIAPAETLMVGDRLDNDILPARAFGWQTWQVTPSSPHAGSGSWPELLASLGTS